jgi:uncharacterized membrane protein YccC
VPPGVDRRLRAVLRVALSHQVLNGISAALGLLLISAGMHLLGPFAASVASVGVLVCIPSDRAAPRRGKFWQLLPAALFGLPLFMAMLALRADPIALGLLLVPATFFAFLGGAWGKRGIPIAISVMLAMIFSMAVSQRSGDAAQPASGWYFAAGAALYLVWSTLSNAVLNARYRTQMLAETVLALVDLVRTQAGQFVAAAQARGEQAPVIGRLLHQQAALTDQLQAARDLLLESPRTPRRQQLAGMLLLVLEIRDHLLACELDLDILQRHPGHAPALATLRDLLMDLAEDLARLADALLLGRLPASVADRRQPAAIAEPEDDLALAGGSAGEPSPAALVHSLTNRVLHIHEETVRLVALARGEAQPDLALVRTAWQMFVSPTTWSFKPLAAVWRWHAPTLRHAIRASLAIGSAYALSIALPWHAHGYWILLTIAVVLRGSLAQTLERRNSRVLGTLLGCFLAAALLWADPPAGLLLLIMAAAQAVAHAFGVRKYLVTAIAASVVGLLQAHLLSAGTSPVFDMAERIADTLIGAVIAWVFSYVLPSWERRRIPSLVARTLSAQARHAQVALGLGQLQAVDNEPELAWRLERREAFDSLSALVQATQRSLSEPRAVRPPLEPLGHLLGHSYQLLAQLTAVKTMLLLRRGQLDVQQMREPLQSAADSIEAMLLPGKGRQPNHTAASAWPDTASMVPDDLTPWALRRLDLAVNVAAKLRRDADEVLSALSARAA